MINSMVNSFLFLEIFINPMNRFPIDRVGMIESHAHARNFRSFHGSQREAFLST